VLVTKGIRPFNIESWRSTLAVMVSTGLGAGALAIGLWDLPAVPAIAVSLTFGLMGSFVSLAITDGKPNRTRHLTFALVLVAILGWELSRSPDDAIELVVVGGRSGVWYAVGEPGGKTVVETVISGTTISIQCKVSVDGVIWYRLASSYPVAWLPNDALRAIHGEEMPEGPDC
jgi:hypothetical protein